MAPTVMPSSIAITAEEMPLHQAAGVAVVNSNSIVTHVPGAGEEAAAEAVVGGGGSTTEDTSYGSYQMGHHHHQATVLLPRMASDATTESLTTAESGSIETTTTGGISTFTRSPTTCHHRNYDHRYKMIGGDEGGRYDLDQQQQHRGKFAMLLDPLPDKWNDWLFPPNIPRSCQLLRMENIALPASYLLVGLLQGLSGPFINVYPLDIGATESQQVTLSSLRSLPASFKLFFGFLSDTTPLCGYRRKSYMAVGWIITGSSMFLLRYMSDLTLSYDDDDDGKGDGHPGRTIASEDAPSVPFLSLCILLFGTGFWFADVMADSVVAEKAKLEPVERRGQIQATCYACRFFGLMIAATLSTVLYSSTTPWCGPQLIVGIMAALPLCILPLVHNLHEPRHVFVSSPKVQLEEIWGTVCSRAVWQPMGFVYLFSALQVGNAAWREFLRSVLNFTANQLNALYIAAYVLLYVGVLVYKHFLIDWSWRSLYVVCMALNGVFSALQLLLIYGKTFGISPFWFALGDDVFGDFLEGIQFLPLVIMMVHLCPSGSEGASYALFTTTNNAGIVLSAALSTMIVGVWDVSKSTLLLGDISGMVKLTVLTTMIQLSPMAFVRLLPHHKEDLEELGQGSRFSGSRIGGFVYLFVTFASMAYSIFVGLFNILFPGWAGESR